MHIVPGDPPERAILDRFSAKICNRWCKMTLRTQQARVRIHRKLATLRFYPTQYPQIANIVLDLSQNQIMVWSTAADLTEQNWQPPNHR